MAKYIAGVAVAFQPQTPTETLNDTFSATLRTAIDSGTLAGTDGLILGDAQSGEFESGLTYTFEREGRDKARWSNSFTRPQSDLLSATPSTFTFAFPFTGNRENPSITPVPVGELDPLLGIQALLGGAYLAGSDGTNQRDWNLALGTQPFSAAVWYNGVRHEWISCRCSMSITFPAGDIPIATVEINVGSANEGATHNIAAALPTLDYGNQALVSAPVVKEVGNVWSSTRGFDTLTLDITPAFEDIGDSNAKTGSVAELSDLPVEITANLYKDDTAPEFEPQQVADDQSNFQPLSFTVGAAPASTAEFILGVGIQMPEPEAVSEGFTTLGNSAASAMSLIGRSSTDANKLKDAIISFF